jgi:hypothetical protein
MPDWLPLILLFILALLSGVSFAFFGEAAQRGFRVLRGRVKGGVGEIAIHLPFVSFVIGAPSPSLEDAPLRARVVRLSQALSDAVVLSDEISRDLEDRAKLLEQLEGEVAKHDHLARLKREEAEAVVEMLRSEIQQGSRRSFWQQVAINFIFFALGIAVTVVIAVWA